MILNLNFLKEKESFLTDSYEKLKERKLPQKKIFF